MLTHDRINLSRKRQRNPRNLLSVGILVFGGYLNVAALVLPSKRGLGSRKPRQLFGTRSSLHASTQNIESIENELSSLTVKELRDVLKNSGLNRRGILSQLKLKKELVGYLSDNLDRKTLEAIQNNAGETPKDAKSSTKPPRPMSMAVKTVKTESDKKSSRTKESIFEKTYQQYPDLLLGNCTGIGEQDIRHVHHPIYADDGVKLTGDMDIIFVGTASCTPSVTRGVSCTALRLNWNRRPIHSVPGMKDNTETSAFSGGTWVFDCGECTQLQVQKTPSVKPGKINKIFLTHAHGDHTFGLPGLLCLMGQDRDRFTSTPIDIYGPEGLRMWLRVAIRYSVSRIVPNYRVHELKDIPVAPEWEFSKRSNRYFYRGLNKRDGKDLQWGFKGLAGEDPQSWISRANSMSLEPSRMYGEVDGGRDIYPEYDHPASSDGAPVWEVEDEGDVRVFAAPMSHSIPCVGYVVEEQSKPGRLRDELVVPIVKRNLNALKEAGFKIPMKALAVIKSLPAGSAFTFPDGTVLTQEEAVEPERRGRKVVICGDTASSRAIEGLAKDADVVVHEATNSYLNGLDKDTDLQEVTRDAVIHGHSTPHMAGKFAQRVGAKKLILNHFSARYKGDQSVESLSVMTRIEGQARKTSGLSKNEVAAAWDFMVLPVRQAQAKEVEL